MFKYSFLQEVQEREMPMWHLSCGGFTHSTLLGMHKFFSLAWEEHWYQGQWYCLGSLAVPLFIPLA